MSERLTLVSPRVPQLECVNQKLSDLSARHPYGDVAQLFALAAYLASEAVEAGTSLQRFPGGDAEALQPVIGFWRALGTYAQAASRSLGGNNETLPHALVAYNLLRNLGEDV